MKIRIKAAVVLNAHETNIVANVLARVTPGKGDAVLAESTDMAKREERKVIIEFLEMHSELKMRMAT